MPTPYPVVLNYHAILYDGTNSAQINDLVEQLVITSESSGILSFESPPGSTSFTANTGDTIVWTQGMVTQVLSEEDMDFFYACNTICDTLPEARPAVRAVGVAAVPTLLLGGSATIPVTLQPAMPDTDFDAYASKFAAVSLTDLSITAVTVVDVDTVNVQVSNVGVATLSGASVMVHAVA